MLKKISVSMPGAVFCLLSLLLISCGPGEPPAYAPEYSDKPPGSRQIYLFGVHPLHNPQRLEEVYGPIVEYLNRRISGGEIRLEASRSYEEFDRKLYSRHFHFALPNPYQTVHSLEHGYRVFGKMGDDTQFRGIILVRKDGGINKIPDLRGKTVSFPAPTALAATMMPVYFLHENGLEAGRDFARLFSGSQESSIMNVYLRKSAAGATWPPPWEAFKVRNPEMADQLAVKWETSPLVNNGLVVRNDVPEKTAAEVARLLFALHESPEGRRLLRALPLARFEAASAGTYKPVVDFMNRFKKNVPGSLP
jgi:phosphonate transport system substrate-binding protein